MYSFKNLSFCFFIFFVFSCNNPTSENNTLPESSGNLGELVLVSTDDVIAENKDLLNNIFLETTDHLYNEPFFEMRRLNPENFMRFFSTNRTVLALVTEENSNEMYKLLEGVSEKTYQENINDTTPKYVLKKNLFAKNQHVVYIFAKNKKELTTKIIGIKDKLLKNILEYEIEDNYSKIYSMKNDNQGYFDTFKKEFGIGINIPKHFTLYHKKNGFYWFQYEAIEENTNKIIGLFVHSYTYNDTNQFTYEGIRSVRDTLLKYNVPAEIPGTYMGTTDSKLYPDIFREVLTISDKYAVKVRGWWNVDGNTMGGPFIRYVIHVPERNTLVAFEGFVYKPNLNTKERDLRLIETIAKSIK